ncbi:MAG: polyprenyl synthetase family protein, partial [Chloroflexota bacterium]
STELGAIVAGADVDARACLAKFGQRLGMAFQVVDDYLGIWGDPKHTGKSAASDLFARKKSYPVIYASQNSDNFAAYYQQPNIDIDHTIDILETSGAKQKTINQAEKYTSLALESLAQSGLEGEAVLALEELLSQLVQRQS